MVSQGQAYSSSHKAHATVHSLLVVLWILHLAHNRQESTCTGTRAEYRGCGYHASSKCRVSDYVVSEIKFSRLRGCCWTIEGGDTNTEIILVDRFGGPSYTGFHLHNNKDGNKDRKEPSPGYPGDLLEFSRASSDEHHDSRDD